MPGESGAGQVRAGGSREPRTEYGSAAPYGPGHGFVEHQGVGVVGADGGVQLVVQRS